MNTSQTHFFTLTGYSFGFEETFGSIDVICYLACGHGKPKPTSLDAHLFSPLQNLLQMTLKFF